MSPALPTGGNGKKNVTDKRMDEVIVLLTRALHQLDAMEAPPELGARLQELLDLVVQHRH